MGDRSNGKVMEGVLAVNKPQGISSAQVLRDLQKHFDPSSFFKPTIAAEARRLRDAQHNGKPFRGRTRRKTEHIKIGHGGTLDPLATGVLITGIGTGTKSLQNFLGCTKSYEATVLFGVATDTYDILGKVITRHDYGHITKEKVLEQLAKMKGLKMQKPPIFSALRHQGKRFYEYAREGKELPIEIAERPIEISELEMTDWMDGTEHDFQWPTEEVEKEVKDVANKVLDLEADADLKRKRELVENDDSAVTEEPALKKQQQKEEKEEDEPLMSGALPTEGAAGHDAAAPPPHAARPPACKIRMTVSSGFYVRTLCHDLGRELGSAGLMAELKRTRQQDFELGKNVFEYAELEKGESVWAPQVENLLDAWNSKPTDLKGVESAPRYEASPKPRRAKESREQSRRRNSSSDDG